MIFSWLRNYSEQCKFCTIIQFVEHKNTVYAMSSYYMYCNCFREYPNELQEIWVNLYLFFHSKWNSEGSAVTVSKIVLTRSTYQIVHLWLLIAVYRNWLCRGKRSECPPVAKPTVDILLQVFIHSPWPSIQEITIPEPTIWKNVWKCLQFKSYRSQNFQLIPMPVLSIVQFVLQWWEEFLSVSISSSTLCSAVKPHFFAVRSCL